MRKSFIYLLIVVFIDLFTCCENTLFQSTPSGTLKGIAKLMYHSNHHGIEVSIDDVNKSALTDSSGNWIIKDLEQGTYTISFNKTGFGLRKYFGYSFLGYDDFFSIGKLSSFPIYLTPIPDFLVASLKAELATWNNNYLHVSGSTSKKSSDHSYVSIFFGEENSVSKEPGTYIFCKCCVAYNDSTFWTEIPLEYIYKSGFSGNSYIHIVAYSGGMSGYYDPRDRYKYYTALSSTPSEVISFLLP